MSWLFPTARLPLLRFSVSATAQQSFAWRSGCSRTWRRRSSPATARKWGRQTLAAASFPRKLGIASGFGTPTRLRTRSGTSKPRLRMCARTCCRTLTECFNEVRKLKSSSSAPRPSTSRAQRSRSSRPNSRTLSGGRT
eukprot:Amastigsp_a841340_283.p3 type:complete len:138 gc:universal Amastigsp_a841340_283:197-610(+)